jgi:hypothetical protein
MASATPNPGDGPAARDHRLAVFSRIPDAHVLAELLCRVLGQRPLDALIAARHTPGVLPTLMTSEEAEQLVSLLHGVSVRAAAVSVACLPDVANAPSIHCAWCRDEGLQILDLYGDVAETILWSHIDVIVIGSIPGEPKPRFIEQGRPAVVSTATMPEVSRVDVTDANTLALWLLCRLPTRAYRMDHARFNYRSLETRKTEAATVNFGIFVRDLIQHAATVRLSPATHAFLSHGHRPQYEFHSGEELQQHALLHWVVRQEVIAETEAAHEVSASCDSVALATR